jgi:hypothetical protein
VVRYFERLGTLVLARWRRHDFDTDALPEVASDCLRLNSPAEHVSPGHIVKWLMTASQLPVQADLDAKFGEPPVTVYSHPRFRIEALFWNTATTSIHQHGFSGAFTVLAGSSIQSHYTFKANDRVSDYLLLGALEPHSIRVLRPGDVEPIEPRDRLIHAVYHLNAPSVSLVIRTHETPGAKPQFEYFRPGLAIDPFFADPLEKRQLQMLRLLSETNRGDLKVWVTEAIHNSTLLAAFHILKFAIDVWGDTSPQYQDIIHAAQHRHGARALRIATALTELGRVSAIHALRRTVRDPRHRLFLALALYCGDMQAMAKVLAQSQADNDTGTSLTQSLSELIALGVLRVRDEGSTKAILVPHALTREFELLRVQPSESAAPLLCAV